MKVWFGISKQAHKKTSTHRIKFTIRRHQLPHKIPDCHPQTTTAVQLATVFQLRRYITIEVYVPDQV